MSQSAYAEVTVTVNNEQFLPIPIDLSGTVEQFQKLIEFETNILVKDQLLLFEGKQLVSTNKISEYNIKHGDLLFLTKRPAGQTAQPQQQQQQQRQRNAPAAAAPQFKNAREFIDHFKSSPMEFNSIMNSNPQIADAILNENEEVIGQLLKQIEHQRRLVELARDPFNEEGQKAIYEAIQQQNIEKNMEHAMEHTPEAFANVIMLYLDCTINNHPIKVFVDTGAQKSIMTLNCARKCGLDRLIDKRFQGIAKGVGTAKIVGRVHAAEMNMGSAHITISLSILDSPGQDTEFIFGLDMLKKHQALVNLRDNVLEFGEMRVPFLQEKDLKEILEKNDPLPENYVPPSPTTTTSTSASTPPTATATTVTSPPPATTSTSKPMATSPPASSHSEEAINTLMSFGATRAKAIDLLNRAGGDIERAASLYFGINKMNRVPQYKVVAVAAVSIGLLVVTPICKPLFGSIFGSTAANEAHLAQLTKKIQNQGEHHDDHHNVSHGGHH
ncbi:ubiquitin-associated domain-containing protein [Heterostelium album PN500]|uniref:Ubiquitin-associated domain-containing protein n=1 Tax=Heterostelium pallidum (strain ATCC 26659 / Pp 5 / PN500) TaxID=670386 RepID=D3B0K6_HETP5|nr:ubiquitin-associated domain-containing protein [Heterostelium album PN500]EFA84830.1 ubiquitin-associated domain-containing protein [Heterostelium album PN500]|eukprot:XP_020436941.1 ubiquitin-associated domain-containing protein [Heterostelium album PN500]